MSFIRRIKSGSGIYRARVENRRVDGKVKQTVVEWMGKAPDTEEALLNRVKRLRGQLQKAQKRLNQAEEQLSNLHQARLEAGRKALAGRRTGYIVDWMTDLRLRMLKVLSDGQWHGSVSLRLAVGAYIRPEIAARADPVLGRYNLDRGRGIIVTRELRHFLLKKRIEKRPGKGRTSEWRLIDRAWAEQVLAKTTGITS